MTMLNIIFLAVALSFDAMAVGAANGAHHHKMSMSKALQISFCFGFFQFFMPLVGWFVGAGFQDLISKFDHWVAFFLLVALGVKMLVESFKEVEEKNIDIYNWKMLLLLSVATSVDALVVGMSFAFLQMGIGLAVVIIGVTTFALTLSSIYLGKKFGEHWGKKAEVVGGLILIAIGLKILLSHLLI